MKFAFTKDRGRRATELVAFYPEKRAALLPLLWLVHEQEGFVPRESFDVIATLCGVTVSEVAEAVSFYTLFRDTPAGRYHIQVCTGPCCSLRGAGRLVKYLETKLGVRIGKTTEDGRFHLSQVECLASCGTAPMMRIDDEYVEDLSEKKLDEILSGLR